MKKVNREKGKKERREGGNLASKIRVLISRKVREKGCREKVKVLFFLFSFIKFRRMGKVGVLNFYRKIARWSGLIIFLLPFSLYGQLAVSTNYILRTSNTADAHTPVSSFSFKAEALNYGITATIGELTVSPSSQLISSNYKTDIGFTPTWNLPPKIVTTLTFPENDRYLYTSKPPFLFANAGDWDYTAFGINDKLHFEVRVSTDYSFLNLSYSAHTRKSILNWFTTSANNAGDCLFNNTGCLAFPAEGIESNSTNYIKHISLTDLPLNNYYWKVIAYDDFEGGEDSVKPIFHYILPIVSTTSPGNEQIINGTSAVLGWQAPPGAIKYQIQISRTCDFSDAIDYFVNSPNLSLTLNGLQDGKYCWRIRPFDILNNPSNYTATFVFYIVTIPVLGVRLLAEFYVIPPDTKVLLRAYLLGPEEQIVNILSPSDIDIFISGKQPPGDPGTLSDKKAFSDRIEITYRSGLSAGITSIKAVENRSGHSFTDSVNIGVFGKLLMLEGQFNPKTTYVKVGEEVVIANFKFWAVSENVKLNDLILQLPPTKVSKILKKIRLVEDVNNDGEYNENVDRLIRTVNRSEFDPPIVIFEKIVELLPRNNPINYLLLGTFRSESTEGDFYLDFVPANSGNAWGLISNAPIGIEGINFSAGPFIVNNNKKTYTCNWGPAINISLRKFSAPLNNIQALHFLVSADNSSSCIWINPTIRISGTGIDNRDISSVKLVEDVNGNGMYEPAVDKILVSDKFLVDDGKLTLPLSITINPGTTRYFFIFIDVTISSPDATYQIHIRRSDQNLLINGLSSKFNGNDFIYGTFLINITHPSKGFVNILNNYSGVSQKSLKPNKANEIMSFTLYNSNLEDVHFRKLKIGLTLDPLKTSFITYGRLYLDISKNGMIDSEQDLLLEKKLFIPNDSLIPSIEFSNFDVLIPKNEYRSFVVALDVSVVYDVSIYLRGLITDSGALTISGSPEAEIDGVPISSQQLIVEKIKGEIPPSIPAQISGGGGGGGCFVQPQIRQHNNINNFDFLFAIILLVPLAIVIIRITNDNIKRKIKNEI